MISARLQDGIETLARYAAHSENPAELGGEIAYFLAKCAEIRNTGQPWQLAQVRALVVEMRADEATIDFGRLNRELDRISGHAGVDLRE